MSNGTDFGKQDGVALRDLVKSDIQQVKTFIEGRIDVLHTLINGNDLRYADKSVSQDQAVKEAFAASQQAIEKSETSQEKRSDAVYVSISELQKALSIVIGRAEFDLQNRALTEKIEILTKTLNDKIDSLNLTTISKQSRDVGIKEGIGTVAVIAGAVSAVVTVLFRSFK
jgi:hypothetical protein